MSESNNTPEDRPILLNGPRQVGAVTLRNGAVEVHAVSGDGAKYTRMTGEPWKSAKDFYASKGMGVDGQPLPEATTPPTTSVSEMITTVPTTGTETTTTTIPTPTTSVAPPSSFAPSPPTAGHGN